jgi:hypothetical protein
MNLKHFFPFKVTVTNIENQMFTFEEENYHFKLWAEKSRSEKNYFEYLIHFFDLEYTWLAQFSFEYWKYFFKVLNKTTPVLI